MCVSRTATAEHAQVFGADGFDAVRRAWGNEDSIAKGDENLLLYERHQAAAGGNVVDLFGQPVVVQLGVLAGFDQ